MSNKGLVIFVCSYLSNHHFALCLLTVSLDLSSFLYGKFLKSKSYTPDLRSYNPDWASFHGVNFASTT
jgi:hypothetical protein